MDLSKSTGGTASKGSTQDNTQIRMDVRLARRLIEKKARLDRYRPLPPDMVRQLADDLRLQLTYHSNAIEGNTLTLRETRIVLEAGVTIGGHPLREHLEATNHARAFDYLMTLAQGHTPLTGETVLLLHSLIMSGIDPDAGQFRQRPVYIRGAPVTPPPHHQVPSLVAAWLEWLEGGGLDYEPLVRVSIAHHQFEAIHPFIDGNGRVGRLLLNLQLMQAGYPPALLLRDWRGAYLGAMQQADTGRYTPLANLIGRSVEGGLDLYLEVCATPPSDEYRPLAELAEEGGYSVNYLGLLARKGHIDAVKRGSRWYSTPSAIEHYKYEVAHNPLPVGRPRRNPS